jgi:hypothetical protein
MARTRPAGHHAGEPFTAGPVYRGTVYRAGNVEGQGRTVIGDGRGTLLIPLL